MIVNALVIGLAGAAFAAALWAIGYRQEPSIGPRPQWWVIVAAALAAAALACTLSPARALVIALATTTIVVGAGTDMRRYLLLDSIAFVGLGATLLAATFADELLPTFFGAGALLLLFGLVNAGGRRFRGEALLGDGDVKLAPLVGAALGPWVGSVTFALAVAAVCALMLSQRREWPLGPFLATSTLAVLAFEYFVGGSIVTAA